MFKMELLIKKSYYNLGEIPLKKDLAQKYVKNKMGNCKFIINGKEFDKRYLTINKQGQIIVYGYNELSNFFKKNFKVNSLIEVEFIEFY